MTETLRARAFVKSDELSWDAIAAESETGTFQHTRRFLSYHGDRFADASIVIEDASGKVQGVFPAAISASDRRVVVSHPGATFGGLLTFPRQRPAEVEMIVNHIVDYYRGKGFGKIIYKSVPSFLQVTETALDRYALYRLGARLSRCDLWSVLRLNAPRHRTKGHKWSVNKAKKHEVQVIQADDDLAYGAFHDLLSVCLRERHEGTPVHSCDELRMLRDRFPNAMQLWRAESPLGELLAGTWVFRYSPNVWHTHYIASTEAGRDKGAVDLLLETVMSEASRQGVTRFSFGSSTCGLNLSEGLFNFKASFGTGSVIHEFFEIDL